MKRLAWTSLVGSLAITGASLSVSAAQAAEGGTARLMVVQAVPGQRIDVLIDDFARVNYMESCETPNDV